MGGLWVDYILWKIKPLQWRHLWSRTGIGMCMDSVVDIRTRQYGKHFWNYATSVELTGTVALAESAQSQLSYAFNRYKMIAAYETSPYEIS